MTAYHTYCYQISLFWQEFCYYELKGDCRLFSTRLRVSKERVKTWLTELNTESIYLGFPPIRIFDRTAAQKSIDK